MKKLFMKTFLYLVLGVVLTASDSSTSTIVVGAAGKTFDAMKPCYWKDGALQSLPMGPRDKSGAANQCLLIPDGGLLIAGVVRDGKDVQKPCFWKEGAIHLLPLGPGRTHGETQGIARDKSGNVYIAGSVGRASEELPCFWENGKLHMLPFDKGKAGEQAEGVAIDVAVDDSGNIYVAGSEGISDDPYAGFVDKPCCWKNGTKMMLPMPKGEVFGVARGMGFSNTGNLFIAGVIGGKACFWKDGKLAEVLPGPGSGSQIALDSTNVYVSGFLGGGADFVPCFWKNGTAVTLKMEPGDKIGTTGGMAFNKAGDFSIVGSTGSQSSLKPHLWKNGILETLSMSSTDRFGEAYGIAIEK